MNEAPAIGIILRSFALGGSERVAIRLGRHWAACGHRVTFLMGSDKGNQQHLLRNYDVVVTAPPALSDNMGSKTRSDSTFGTWCGEEAQARNLSILFIPGNSYYPSIRALRQKVGAHAKIIAQLSNPIARPDRSRMRNSIFSWLSRFRLSAANHVVAMSPRLASDARQVLGANIPLEIIASPILDSSKSKTLTPNMVCRNPKQLCVVARLEPQKNVAFAISALAALADPDVTLHVAGDGSLRARLQVQAETLGIGDRVIFHGIVNDVGSLLRQSAAMLLTSDFEGYPAVAVEALAHGTPVIARRCSSALDEIITEAKFGRVITTASPQDFAQAIADILQNPPKLQPADCDAQYQRYDIAAISKQYEQLFQRGEAP